jgi:hypothetical protein
MVDRFASSSLERWLRASQPKLSEDGQRVLVPGAAAVA